MFQDQHLCVYCCFVLTIVLLLLYVGPKQHICHPPSFPSFAHWTKKAMPHPNMQISPWKAMRTEAKLPLFEALESIVADAEHDIILITAGCRGHKICPAMPDIIRDQRLPHIDVRPFFPTRSGYNCFHKTSFTSAELYLSYLDGLSLWHARTAIIEALQDSYQTATGSGSWGCVVFCSQGLHRSQAAARFFAESVAHNAVSTCIVNAATFTQEWCPTDCRVLVKKPNGASTQKWLTIKLRCVALGGPKL